MFIEIERKRGYNFTQLVDADIQTTSKTELSEAEIGQVSGGCPNDQPPMPHITIHELAPRPEREYQVSVGSFALQLG